MFLCSCLQEKSQVTKNISWFNFVNNVWDLFASLLRSTKTANSRTRILRVKLQN